MTKVEAQVVLYKDDLS